MKLITTDKQLRSMLPNVFITVENEPTLFDKLSPFLQEAEKWLIDNFTSEKTFTTIAGYSADNNTKILAMQIVCLEAYRRAVPSLDLVLTPNGFGIVSNSNIAPASKERVERLLQSLLKNRDYLIELFIPLLYVASGWKTTEQAAFFGSTLFPNISLTKHFDSEPNRWDHYQKLRSELIPVEQWIADNFISEGLLDVFRQETLSNSVPDYHRTVIKLLRSVEIRILRSGEPSSVMHFEHDMLTQIVDIIRNDEEHFPEWHSSKTADLFNPTVFENKKEAKGYFF